VNVSRLRWLLRKGGLPGLLVVACCLGLHGLGRRRSLCAVICLFAAVAGTALCFPKTTPLPQAIAPYQTMTPQQTYTFSDLGVMPGALSSSAVCINAAAQVVGNSAGGFLWQEGQMQALAGKNSQASGINNLGAAVGYVDGEAFYWRDGKLRLLGTFPDGGGTRAASINDHDQVVGSTCAGTDHGARSFLWEKGKLRSLGTLPSGHWSRACSINNHGQVAGYANTGAVKGSYAVYHAMMWDQRNGMQDLGTIGGATDEDSQAYGINDDGTVVGKSAVKYARGLTSHAFQWKRGRMEDLGVLPGGWKSAAVGINSRGDIVGLAETPGDCRAVLWKDGKILDLNSVLPANSGWKLVCASGINAKGQIVGVGCHGKQYRAYLLSPR
jgi:probable HAF family extracellular repeat protein